MSFLSYIFLVDKRSRLKKHHAAPENVIEEEIQPLFGGKSQSSLSGKILSFSSGSSPFISSGVSKVGLKKGHTSPPLVGTPFVPQNEQDNSDVDTKIGINIRPLSSCEPPAVKRARSAEQLKSNSRSPSPPISSLPLSRKTLPDSHDSRKPKVAWDFVEKDRAHYTNESDITRETYSNGQTDSNIQDLDRGLSSSDIPQNTPLPSFREHDEETLSVLNLRFPPSTTPTLGLSQSVLPPESQLERYYSLVENAIIANMVAPLNNEWKKKTHDFLPKDLRESLKNTLEELDKVKVLFYNKQQLSLSWKCYFSIHFFFQKYA